MAVSSIHSPLPSTTSIRLLYLEPSTALHLSRKPFANLEVVELSQAPPYEALSYTWGETSERPCIAYINDQKVGITQNLSDFFHRVRSRFQRRVVWVDALCISQTDLQEKANQVRMIGDIFRSATRVLVWLGPHANDSAQLFRKQKQGELLSDLYIPTEQGNTIAAAWCYFFTRQYWSRTWIVQEIVLAKTILLHCGNSELNWEDITKLFTGSKTSELLKHYLKWSDPIASKDFHTGANRIRALVERRSQEQDLRRLFPDRYNFTDIFNLIIACKDTKCSDKRDKVYALLSLCEADTGIEPDYKITTEELFILLFAQETRLAYDDFDQVAVSMDLYSLYGCQKIVSCLVHGDGLSSKFTLRLFSWMLRSVSRRLCTEVYGAAGLDRFHPREVEISAMSSNRDRLQAEALKLKQEIELRIPEQERKEAKARSKIKQKTMQG